MYYKETKKSKNFKKKYIASFYEQGFPYPLEVKLLEYEDIDIKFNNWVYNQSSKEPNRLTLEKLIVCYEQMIEREYGIHILYSLEDESNKNIQIKEEFDRLKHVMSYFTLLCQTIKNHNISNLFTDSDFETYEYRKDDFMNLFAKCTSIL